MSRTGKCGGRVRATVRYGRITDAPLLLSVFDRTMLANLVSEDASSIAEGFCKMCLVRMS